jgi:hypothetical protein
MRAKARLPSLNASNTNKENKSGKISQNLQKKIIKFSIKIFFLTLFKNGFLLIKIYYIPS